MGPIYATSQAHFDALKQAANGGQKLTFANLPDWSGLWLREPLTRRFDAGFTGKGSSAPLNAEYKKKYEARLAELAKGIDWDTTNLCLPAGHPRSLAEPTPREFYVRPEMTVMTNEYMNDIRRIRTNGESHTPDDESYPLWDGDSLGFWAGDSLVIHTNQLRGGNYGYSDPDYSDQISTVEVWRKTAPDTITDTITIYDPGSLTRPWTVVQTYKKQPPSDYRIKYMSCAENNRFVKAKNGGTRLTLPGEPDYADPNTFGDEPDRLAAGAIGGALPQPGMGATTAPKISKEVIGPPGAAR
jgi:hypothetical protein